MAVDYYAVLGVAEDASPDEIKRAFRELARRHHPDATGNDPEAAERYKRISEAYSILSDPERRRRYDAERSGAWMGSPFGATIEDIFGSLFGVGTAAPRQRTRARQGESFEVTLEVEFRESVFGAERTMTFQRFEPCARCQGSGTAPGTHPERCVTCEGSGQVQQVRRTVLGSMVTQYPCPDCAASGWVVPNPCSECGGDGRLAQEVEVPITVPPGVETGDRMRLRGEGEMGTAGGGRGDLYVRFLVRPDDRFTRSGDDLVTWAEIPMTVAALGGEVVFDSLDGTERIVVAPGTQSGDVYRVRGRGAVRRGGGRGNLVVRIHVATPTDLDAEQEDLLRQLAVRRGEHPGEGGGFLGRLRRALGREE